MKEIPLTQGKTALVDDCDYEMLMQWKWYARWTKESKTFYALSNIEGKPVYMHRLIMGAIRGQRVDHKDRNGLHESRENLRFCSRSQNHANSGMRVNNTSGFKGVFLEKRNGYWYPKVTVNKKLISLGGFSEPELAAKAYDEAAVRYFGEFALTNAMLGTL